MSPKPWAKLEVGYLNHPKFLALNANAICLWHEGKQYCDMYHTDGLIPATAVKRFRFRGAKSMALLMTTCGEKPDGTAYAPLWEQSAVGYKMHDYLDHNDCRDAVLARMELADERRDAERERKADWRAKKKEKRDVSHGTNHGTGTSQSRSITEALPETEPVPEGSVKNTEPTTRAAATPRLAVSKEPNDNGNYRVIERLAIELLGERPFDDEAELIEATKVGCASAGIDYGAHPDVESDVVHRACASALIKARFGPRRQGAAR